MSYIYVVMCVFPSAFAVCGFLCVCGTDAPSRGPIPCHSGTTSQSFLGSKISSPPPFHHMCSSRQHLSPSE